MIANQGLLGMHCPVATLVGWLGWCGLETRGSLMGRTGLSAETEPAQKSARRG